MRVIVWEFLFILKPQPSENSLIKIIILTVCARMIIIVVAFSENDYRYHKLPILYMNEAEKEWL